MTQRYEAPTTLQVATLAEIGTISTEERGALRRVPADQYCYALDEREYFLTDELHNQERAIRHTLGMRVGRTALGAWQLSYAESHYIDQQASARTVYRFEWEQTGRVKTAVRKSHIVDEKGDTRQLPSIEPVSLELLSDQDWSRWWHNLASADNYTQMTAGDCELLAHHLLDYYTLVAHEQASETSH